MFPLLTFLIFRGIASSPPGTQAVVRLLLMQKERDRLAGLNTAGLITGYRGSPLGGIDMQMHRAKSVFDPNDIKFMPGLNEDLAATAIWGAQQAEIRGEGKYDGVFAIWYGKGPGVDRCGDVFRHANLAGTGKMAACSRLWATITPRNPRQRRTNPSFISSM